MCTKALLLVLKIIINLLFFRGKKKKNLGILRESLHESVRLAQGQDRHWKWKMKEGSGQNRTQKKMGDEAREIFVTFIERDQKKNKTKRKNHQLAFSLFVSIITMYASFPVSSHGNPLTPLTCSSLSLCLSLFIFIDVYIYTHTHTCIHLDQAVFLQLVILRLLYVSSLASLHFHPLTT